MSLINQLLNPGQESINYGDATPEEAITSAIEMGALDAEINTEVAQLGRLEDIAKGLDNVVGIAGHITSATRPEAALVANSLELAFAGENSTAIVESASYGLESAEGGTMACEGVKDIAIKLWGAIKRLMRNIREKVVSFFKSRWGAVASLRKTLTKLKKKAEATQGKVVEETKTELGREVKMLYVADKNIKDEKTILAGLEQAKQIAGIIYMDYAKAVNTAGQAIADALGEFNTEKQAAAAAVQTAVAAASKLVGPNGKGGRSIKDSRVPDNMTVNVTELLFNQVKYSYSPDLGSISDVNEKAERLSKSRILITGYNAKGKKPNDEGSVETLTTGGIVDGANSMLDALEELERYEGSTVFKDIDKVTKDISKAGDSVAKDVAKDDDLDRAVVSSSKALRSLATGYARWSSEGFTSFGKYIVDTGNGFATIANKCLANYK